MEKYSLKNQIEKVLRGENTSFLNPIDANYVINGLKKNNVGYKVFRLFLESEKLIIYRDKLAITLFEIITASQLTHREILGAFFSHNLCEDVFGDIIVDDDRYYIVVLNKVKKELIYTFDNIGKKKVKLVERDLDTVKGYHLKFREIRLQVSSLRIDGIISKLVPTSRSVSNEMISLRKVIVNYQILKNRNYTLKGNDIFSIRGVGKFRLVEVLSKTKTNKYIIVIYKYI